MADVVNASLNVSAVPPTVDAFSIVVGSCYLCTGAVFIVLQLLCAYLICSDKEMRNPTYQLVVNLGIADAVELVVVGVYTGIVIITGGTQNSALGRFMSFLLITAWYANGVLFVFIAFSRWVAITRAHLVAYFFG